MSVRWDSTADPLEVPALPEYRPAAPHRKRWEPERKALKVVLQLHQSTHTCIFGVNFCMFSWVNSLNSSYA